MTFSDQVFVVLLVPILALIPQLSLAAIKKIEKHRQPNSDRDEESFYFGL